MPTLDTTPFAHDLADDLVRHRSDDGVQLWWLGQAGFLIAWRGRFLLLDAYLSDHLAEKYAGSTYPHVRLMAAPIAITDLPAIDWCLATHGHSDHLDPGLVGPLAAANPHCRFVVPTHWRQTAVDRGIPEKQLCSIDAGLTVDLDDGLSVEAVPAAHEQVETDDQGQHRWLGYVLDFAGLRIYHSGDCCPYEGLVAMLHDRAPHLALLPVNGRDEGRTSSGILGNFHAHEAGALCAEAGIPFLLPHHVGLFDFNTVSQDAIARDLAPYEGAVSWRHANRHIRYTLSEAP